MKQFMKNRKAIAFVLLIAMMFSIMPTAVWASESVETTSNGVFLYSAQQEPELTTASALMMNIAESYVDNSSEWVIMDMAAYAEFNPADDSQTADGARQQYINKTIGKVTKTSYFLGNLYYIFRSPIGIICLVIIPCLTIIIFHIIKIINPTTFWISNNGNN